jgi:hypothetical protein
MDSSITLSLTTPPAPGDVVLAIISRIGVALGTPVILPAGWIQLDSVLATCLVPNQDVTILMRPAGANEPSSWIFAFPSPFQSSGVVVSYRNANPMSLLDEHDYSLVDQNINGGAFVTPPLAAAQPGEMILAVYLGPPGTWSTQDGLTLVDSTQRLAVFDGPVLTAGPVPAKTVYHSSASCGLAYIATLRAAAR